MAQRHGRNGPFGPLQDRPLSGIEGMGLGASSNARRDYSSALTLSRPITNVERMPHRRYPPFGVFDSPSLARGQIRLCQRPRLGESGFGRSTVVRPTNDEPVARPRRSILGPFRLHPIFFGWVERSAPAVPSAPCQGVHTAVVRADALEFGSERDWVVELVVLSVIRDVATQFPHALTDAAIEERQMRILRGLCRRREAWRGCPVVGTALRRCGELVTSPGLRPVQGALLSALRGLRSRLGRNLSPAVICGYQR